MKTSITVLLAAFSAKAVQACDAYRYCWCEMDNFEFEGKVQDNIAWDLATEATCGPPGELVYAKGVNYKECYYYKRSYNPFVGSEGLDNCAWKESCKANGASDGWCRDVI